MSLNMDISNKISENELVKKENDVGLLFRDRPNRDLLLPVVSSDQPSAYLLHSNLQMNQEEALRGVSLEALSHIMQSSCQPSSSHFVMLNESFNHSPSSPYKTSSCTIQTYNTSQEKLEPSVAKPITSDHDEPSSANHNHHVFCPVCKMTFTDSSELTRHRQTSCIPTASSQFGLKSEFGVLTESFSDSPPTTYQASCSLEPFNSSQEKAETPIAEAVYSDDEERSQTNEIGVMCSVCKMNFPDTSALLSHRRSVHRGQISCEFCGKSFANTHNLKIHSFSHTGDTRSKSFCNSCGKGFVKPSDLRRHTLIHTRRYSCLECNITFNTADEVKEHSKTHDDFASNCSDCKPDFNNHQSTTSSSVSDRSENEMFSCDVCGLSLESKFDLKAHSLKHTGSSNNVCDICGKTFSCPSDLNRHSVVHTGERPFSCSECDMSFTNQSNLRTHLMTHSDIKPHPCLVCEKSFRRSTDLERHACIHSGARPFACNLCPMAFTTNYNLKIHQLKHSGGLPYRCTDCEKAFSKPSELQRHALLHTGERPFTCPQCGMTFSNSSNLRNHMITHTGRRPYPCNICKKAFTRPSDVKRHVLTHTGARPFACQICGLAFADSSNLKKHTLTHSKHLNHFNKTMLMPPYRCQVCDITFNTSSEIESHIKNSHSEGSKEFLTKLNNIKQYSCAICGLRFAHAIHLQEHSLSHDREHSFQCEICDKSFSQELFLQQHLLTHTEARPYECPECFKCFKSSSHLKNHIPIHSGVKPFICGTCNKAFLKNASLRRHQTIHARGNTVACHICGKNFLNMEYLKKHSVSHES